MLIESILWKFGHKQGLTLHGHKVVEWPYDFPVPSDEELNNIVEEYKKKEYYKFEREKAYKQEIYPHLDNAKMLAELENDNSKMNELKAKKQEIDARHPGPSEQNNAN